MSTYRVGSDHSGGADQNCVDKICEILENAGHTAVNLGVTPNLEGQLGGGDVGVFVVNGMCLATWHSCYDSLIKGGKCQQVIFAFPWVLFKGNDKFNKAEDLTDSSKKLNCVKESWVPASYYEDDGKWTVAEAFQQYDGLDYVEGKTCEDIGNAILNGNFGGGGSSTQSTKEGSIMSGWESITDLLKPLDGEAMVVVRGDSVIIKRIYPPESTKLWVYEGINVVDDSVTISDYSPEIYNTFVINWGAEYENQMEVSFNKHKELFGERKTEVKASYMVPEGEEPVWMTETGEEETTESEGGSVWDSIMGFFGGGTGQESSSLNGSSSDIGKNLNIDNNMSTGTGDEVQYSDVPIIDEAEAFLFGLKTIGRARRKDGHQIECKVIGSKYWEVGEWAKVYLPSFNEDTIMFISKVNHESGADSEWLTSLTLVDYPPSLGSGQSNTPSSDSGSSEQTEQGVLNSLPNDASEENNSSENNGGTN